MAAQSPLPDTGRTARPHGRPAGPDRPGDAPPSGRRRLLPWAVILLWVALLAVAAPLGGQLSEVQSDDSVEYLPESAESTRVARLQQDLPGGGTTDLLVVHEREDGLTEEDRRIAEERVAGIADRWDAAGEPRGILSEDGTVLLHPLSLPAPGADGTENAAGTDNADDADGVVFEIREAASEDLPEGLTVLVGGPGAFGADAGEVFGSIDTTLLIATVAVVTLLLILIYRSPALWLLPLISVGAAAMLAMAVVYGLVRIFDLTVSTQNSSIMTVLVFGAGTDYALLLVARYRDELRRFAHPHNAMVAALRGVLPALLASSGTVAAGLLCLLAADLNSSSGLGPVGTAGILCALLAMITLLPALLLVTGRKVFWPMIPAPGTAPRGDRGLFARLGASVSHRPVAILVTGVVALGALALGTLNLPGPLRDADFFTTPPESTVAAETLGEAFPERSTRPITVLAPEDTAEGVLGTVSATDGVDSAEPGRSGAGWTEINVFATGAPESAEERDTVRALREDLADDAGGEPAALVGGPTAQAVDLDDTNARDRVIVIPLVLLAVLVILIALLRSVVAPLVLLAGVVLSWGSALGLGGLFFGPVFGFDGMDGWIPLLTFVFGVALGVDYGIFLMHRMREEALAGADTRTAALTALRATGGVIASAGIVLAATFSVLMTLPLVVMVELGFVVAVGVLLDTFVVRTYLVTSAAWLLRERMWWPGPLWRRPPAAPAPEGGHGPTGGTPEGPETTAGTPRTGAGAPDRA
ncbi:MMPL family transporter [Streptomyces calidiresistens]|uniref:MMPL family transporter n=1 Tax=Streptomyces calidiresistens TaxID=1485586 RepID=A0A7W3T0D1_9ACTN|nr:MMPL family transporter [Streptomyces calidiresistens]MBB0228585.1 MMPL family transporter [Streptomyces calidiresistens]